MNFSSAGPSHRLQFFMKCSSMGPLHGCSPSATDGSPWGRKSCQKTCSSLGSYSHVLPGACFSVGSPQGHSLLWGTSTCSGVGSSMGCRWISAPPRTSTMGCRVTACLTMVFSMGYRGISALAPWGISSPSFCTDLGVCRVVSLTYSHSSLPAAVAQLVLPFLKCVITEVLQTLLIGSALASSGSIFEPSGTGSVGHRRSVWHLLTEDTAVASPLPKPYHINQIHLGIFLTHLQLLTTF